MRVFEGGTPRLFRDDSNTLRLTSGDTVQRLTARDTNYVIVHPLRRHASIVDGMVSLDLRDTSGTGDELQSLCHRVLRRESELLQKFYAELAPAVHPPSSLDDES